DVVLGTVGHEAAVTVRREQAVRGVDVRAVRALGQTEADQPAVRELGSGLCLGCFVVTLEDDLQTECRHSPRVPVLGTVEPGDLIPCGDSCGVPMQVGVSPAL